MGGNEANRGVNWAELRRRAKKGTVESELTVFSRGKSLLCAARMSRRSWMVYLARGGEGDVFVATEAEAGMMLRGWVSEERGVEVGRMGDFE